MSFRVATSSTSNVLASNIYTASYKWGFAQETTRRPILWFKTRKALKQHAAFEGYRFAVISSIEQVRP